VLQYINRIISDDYLINPEERLTLQNKQTWTKILDKRGIRSLCMLCRQRIIILLVLVLFSFADSAMSLPSATEEVKKVVDEVVSIVSNPEMKKPENKEKRQKDLKYAISAIFDFAEMAKSSLGNHWTDLTPEQKDEFEKTFETLLENTYSKKIESYNNERIVYLKETVDGDSSEVKSKVVTSKHDEFTLDYRLLNKGGKWMIHDVVIEGVSLVANYRSQFHKVILKEGYPALYKNLNAKNKETSMQ
jgi:phospholipid transport system substrate-binding protein